MFDRILFPTDGSDGATAVYDHVLDVAADHGAEVRVLNVVDTTPFGIEDFPREAVEAVERDGGRIVDEAAATAEEGGVSATTCVTRGFVAGTITADADEHDVDCIAMPTHGRKGLERLLLGSVTERVLRTASVPVLTLRPAGRPFQHPYRNVLVPTDGSEHARAALERGVDVAKRETSTLHLLSIVDWTSLGVDVRSDFQTDALEDEAKAVVEDAAAFASESPVETVVESVDYGDSVHGAIRAYVDANDVDLVVVGTRGQTGLRRLLLGSVTEKLVRTSPVPVLTVPKPRTDA